MGQGSSCIGIIATPRITCISCDTPPLLYAHCGFVAEATDSVEGPTLKTPCRTQSTLWMSFRRTACLLIRLLGCRDVPELDRLVSAPRRQQCAARAERHGQHGLGMPLEDGDVLAGADVPEHDALPARGEDLAVRAERHGSNQLAPGLDVDGLGELLAIPYVQELDFARQRTAHGQDLAVRAERQGVDPLNQAEGGAGEFARGHVPQPGPSRYGLAACT